MCLCVYKCCGKCCSVPPRWTVCPFVPCPPQRSKCQFFLFRALWCLTVFSESFSHYQACQQWFILTASETDHASILAAGRTSRVRVRLNASACEAAVTGGMLRPRPRPRRTRLGAITTLSPGALPSDSSTAAADASATQEIQFRSTYNC